MTNAASATAEAAASRYEVFRIKSGEIVFRGSKRECWTWMLAAQRAAQSLMKPMSVSWRRAEREAR